MSSDLNWDDFVTGGDFVKFETVGDKIVGEILSVRVGTDFNSAPCPQLLIRDDDGEERMLTAGQKVLQGLLAEKRPEVGDRIAIVYSGIGDARPGKAPPKLFTVEVKPAADANPGSVDASALI